ncbi:MAG: PEP/pyruvate-binding domain-containing protein [Myxococcota bacterium]|nr:PEP/pyruvate-binding domain-containing protein [Myxococcota bacterium]
MIQTKPLLELEEQDATWAGFKAVRLGQLGQAGFTVPAGIAIGAEAYRCFVESTGLLKAIQLMLHRKKFEDMRWEELWDLALRVRNLFARTALPLDLRATLAASLRRARLAGPVVVRSAGLHEDSKAASFAGLHDSFINVRGTEEILKKIVLVWASLWSDRALLYRQELGLDPSQSRIAVIVQTFVLGIASGVAFSRGPSNQDELVIEGVWGLNQGMVDGTVPPHRWHLDRHSGRVKQIVPVDQRQALRTTATDVRLVDLSSQERGALPLQALQLKGLYDIVTELEAKFRAPQDVEWTLTDSGFVLLQSRPITTGVSEEPDDKRRWYLTLHRSIDNLKRLRKKIQQEVLPGMEQEADDLAAVDLRALNAAALASEIRRRQSIRDRWVDAYWEHCIPFAHGMRIFGQIYNDRCQPDDPFEFIELLRNDALLGAQRNTEMYGLSQALRNVDAGQLDREAFDERVDAFLVRFGLTGVAGRPQDREGLLALLTRLQGGAQKLNADQTLGDRFLDRFSAEERDAMAELLDLARDSYSLRDDDNIYLGRIEAQLVAAVREASRRVGESTKNTGMPTPTANLIQLLEDPTILSLAIDRPEGVSKPDNFELRARQLVGQPASPGLAIGRARVIVDPSELLSFHEGEILVCDAIDPNMTFVAPLAAGVVERRGGMLIHGAIIAREYGIPCVTGVPDAASWIQTGDTITVDGHLGLVTLSATVSSGFSTVQQRSIESGPTRARRP